MNVGLLGGLFEPSIHQTTFLLADSLTLYNTSPDFPSYLLWPLEVDLYGWYCNIHATFTSCQTEGDCATQQAPPLPHRTNQISRLSATLRTDWPIRGAVTSARRSWNPCPRFVSISLSGKNTSAGQILTVVFLICLWGDNYKNSQHNYIKHTEQHQMSKIIKNYI